MTICRLFFALSLVCCLLMVAQGGMAASPILIAHRGASADRPEHTIAAYRTAIEQGADFIEPDLVISKDGILVVRHENEIGGTTDVASRPEFASRRTSRIIDGQKVTGWFTEDFTLAELKSLSARERLPRIRPANRRFDGQDRIPTFDEVIDLALTEGKARGRPVGIYVETKHPSYFRKIGLPLEEKLLDALRRHGLDRRDAPVFIQSFEVGNLQALRQESSVRLIQLMDANGSPADQPLQSYALMAQPEGLKSIATYADGIGPHKDMLIPRSALGLLKAPTSLAADARTAGLLVHAWTFRPENAFLPTNFRVVGGLSRRGRAVEEIRHFLSLGIDGVFSDSVVDARQAIDQLQKPD